MTEKCQLKAKLYTTKQSPGWLKLKSYTIPEVVRTQSKGVVNTAEEKDNLPLPSTNETHSSPVI